MKFSFKLVTTLIAVILTVCCIATVFAAADVTSFTDFPAGSWSDAALRAGVNNGLIQGKGDGTIAPKDYITRAETATIINRAFGATVRADISQYTDVSPSKWYYAEMQKAVNMRTVEGVSSTKINPEGYITREQVFTILARALVLSDADESKLMTFADESSVSSWARGYTAALVNRGYVNGNTENRLKPKDYITREEFAQVMHNIFKQYINGYNSVLSDATLGTTVVRTPNLTLKNLVINGDLIIADGVGRDSITLENVKVSGRILFRGGGTAKLTKTTVGEFVIIHDVNGVVNFQNYESESVFKDHIQSTKATFLKKPTGGGSSISREEVYTITFDGTTYYVSKGGKLGDAKAEEDGTKLSDAIANYKPEAGYTNKGFKDKATGKDIDLDAEALGDVDIEPIDELTVLYAIYNANGGTMNGASVYKDEDYPFDKLTSYTLLATIPVWTGEGNYTFAGWYIDKTTQEIVTTIPAGQVADVTLYAKWVPYSTLTFKYNSAKSDEDTVAIDVVIDKLPYGVDAITYIDAEYSFLKDGTSQKAELTYHKVTSAHGGTLIGTESKITLDGVSITAGGTLFTIEFTKAKDYAENVKFDFGTVTIKENGETVTQYNKKSAVINALTGLQTHRIEFNNKTYIVYENEKIGDARQEGNESYTLADAFTDYISGLDDEIYIFNGFVDADNKDKEVKASDVVSSGMTLTKIVADVDLIKFDVTYNAGEGTVNGKKTYTVENAFDYETAYTLLDENKLALVYEGYEFKGWYMQSDPSKNITEIAKNTKGDVTVYAKWEPIKYDVTYDALAGVFDDGKSTYKDEDAYDADTDYTVKALVPKRDSYVFAGWYFDKDTWLKPAGSTISKNTKADVTLYARWEPNVNLTFVYNSAKSDEDTVAIDVVMDKLPYGVSEIDYIDAVYSFVKEGTDVKAELAYDKVTSAHGGTLNGSDGRVTLVGVSIKAGGTLFTIEFTKAKDYTDNVTFAFGDVVIKEDGKAVEGYNKNSTTINALTGLHKYEIEFNEKTYLVYEGETIGDAKAKDGTKLSDALKDYEDNLDDEIYIFNGFVDANDESKEVKATDVVSSGMTLKKIVADTDLVEFDVTYDAGEGTVNGKKAHTVENAFDYETKYTLLGEDKLNLEYEGYKFDGWYMQSDPSKIITEIAKNTKGDVTVYAKWQIIEYDIIYNANGGIFDGEGATITKDKVHTVEDKHAIDKNLIPTRDGYLFAGWYKDAQATQPVGDTVNYLPSNKTETSITIYAGWTKVYKITLAGKDYTKDYILEENKKFSEHDELSKAMQAVIDAQPNGKKTVFTGTYHNVSETVTLDTKATADMTVTYEYVAIPYAVEYNLNNGIFKQGVNEASFKTYTVDKALTLPTAEHVYKSDAENDYDFKGWYDNEQLSGEPITEIPAGQTGPKTFWAKWEAKPKQGLGFFAGERDEDANTAVMYMTLTEVPYDIDELAYIELDYWYGTQISPFTRNLPFRFVSAEPLFEAESFEARDGKVIWSNHTKPITTAELKANGGKLFKLVFEFNEDISGKRIFKYTENGTVLKAKDNTQSTKYEIFDGSIPFNVTYSIITYEQDITNDYNAVPTYTESYTTGRAEEDMLVNYNVTKEGFTIDESKSNLSGKNDGTLEIVVYYNRNKYTAEFNGDVYNFLHGHKLLGSDGKQGTALKAALQAHSQNTEEGYEWTYTTDTGITLDLEKDYDVTKSLKISAEYGLKKYDIIYYTSATEPFVPEGAETTYTTDKEYILPRPEKEGFDFVDWYDNKDFNGTPITKIEKGSTGTKKFWAKWVRTGEAVLKFTHENNEEQKTITVKVVLTNIPKNIDNLAAIEIHYTQTPSYLKWDKATKSATFGGTFIHNNKDGVLTWYNENDSITPEELNEKGGVLFTIVYPYDEFPSVEEIILSYNKDKTTLASSDFKEGTGYKLEDGKITFAKTCVIDFNETKYFVTAGGNLGDAKATDGTKLSDVMANYKPKAGYENKGFKIKGTETKVDADTIVTDSMDIEPDDEIIYYSVTYDAGDGEFADGKHTVVEEKAYTVEKDYTVKNLTPEREGYDFAGWYYDEGKWQEPAPAGSTISKETMKNITLYAKWEKIDDEPDVFTVTFYEGTTDNKGSIEVKSGDVVTESQVKEKFGSPDNYNKQEGYTNSDGIVHEISPELWYKDGDDWKIFVPDKVKIVKDTDVYLLTRYVAAYYDTDFEFRGIKLPQKEIVIPYDSNTDLWESAMDTLTKTRDVVASTLYDVEYALDVDLFSAMLEKAAKTGIVDEDGNILNPEVPVPLHKLLTEELIMKQIDNYIDANINNEEFIAEILRNDTVVNMLLEDEGIRNKVLSDESMRNKLLTTATIKNIIKSGNKPDGSNIIIDYVITNQTFKDKFIGSQAPFDYIVDDLKALYDKNEYHDMILDACVEFVIDVYFENTVSAPELITYIDGVLDDDDFIADIESKPELRSLFRDELKILLTDLDKPETSADTKKEVYETIRASDTMIDAIIDAILKNDHIMDDIMSELKTDLASANSKYKDVVITTVKTEFSKQGSALKSQIIEAVKDDLELGSASVLRGTVIEAITKDFNSDESQLKGIVITTAKTQITTPNSPLRNSILTEAVTAGSAIEGYVKDYASKNDSIKDEIKPLVKENDEVKTQAQLWISTNVSSVNGDIKSAVLKNEDALIIAIKESDPSISDDDAKTYAKEYVSNEIDDNAKAEIEGKINDFFADDTKVRTMIEKNFDTFYNASYDTLFDKLYADPEVFDKAYASYVSDSAKLASAFDKYVGEGNNLETAVNKFIENTDNLAQAIEIFVDTATDTDIEEAVNTYIADDDNLISAVNTYIADPDGLTAVTNIFKSDKANLKTAFKTYIADDGNLGDAIHIFAGDKDVFDTFYEDHLGPNATNSDTFNALFESYYHTHVHEVAEKAWNNKDLHDLVMTYVRTYTNKMVQEYTSGELAAKNEDLADTIYKLLHEQFPDVIRQKYYEEGSTIKASVDLLIEEEGTKLIKQYANDELDSDMETFIDGTIKENIGIIVDDYLDGKLDPDIEGLINAEIDSYMKKLVEDYISNENDARKTLGELIPTYAQDAVDTLKATDAFKNTISDFTSGNGVRVNEDNIMFISILSSLMGEYDYDKIMADFAPEKVANLANKIGHDLAAKYVNALLDTFVGGIKDAEAKLQADLDNDIEGTEYEFTTTPRVRVYIMDDFVVDMYNKAMPKVADKLNSKELIAVNPYAQKLINKNWITELLDYDSTKVSEKVSGYSIKKGEYDEEYDMTGSPIMTYIDIVLENTILLYDAVMWYGDYYGEATVEAKLDAVSALMGTYANKANDIIMHYIQTGELPKGYTPYEIADKILDRVLGVNDKIDDAYDKVEDKYYENEDRILELVDKMKKFYTEKLDKDYTEVIDLASLSVYADGKAYPVYKILLGISDKDDAFNIDTLAEAIDDSDNYHGINALEKAMNKIKSGLNRFEDKNIASALRIIRNAYKVTVPSKEIKGFKTGTHTVKLHRYFE